MNTIVYLIRHGKTVYNEQNKYCGSIDEPLNEAGRKQAEALKPDFKDISLDAVYSSGLKRAKQTAEIVFPGREIINAPGMNEMNFGEWEGRTFDDIAEDTGSKIVNWFNKASEIHPPGGESLKNMIDRVLKAFAVIVTECKGKTIAIATHGGPIAIILCTLNNYDINKLWDLIPPHATATEVHMNDKGSMVQMIKPKCGASNIS